MIERLLQGPATPQQPQNLLGGEFAPRITPSPVEPAQPQQPQQPNHNNQQTRYISSRISRKNWRWCQ
jgi:hypothetical protein